jgi:hypothetical protein
MGFISGRLSGAYLLAGRMKKTRRPEGSAVGKPTRRGGYRDALMTALL